MTRAAKGTVLKLLAGLGPVCAAREDDHNVNLDSRHVQCDKIWGLVHAKAKNVPDARKGEFGVGDIWMWVAIDSTAKLVINWTVGNRDTDTAIEFCRVWPSGSRTASS